MDVDRLANGYLAKERLSLTVERWDLPMPAPIPVVSSALRWKLPKVTGIAFSQTAEILPRRAGPPPPREYRAPRRGYTRLAPSKDVVKWTDRLRYLLQPPLEILFEDSTLEFPFAPFPYQFAGVAFLFTRRRAILADEMGLGKTMQSITAVRMLIRSGQARRVLLICPKPLMTNWLREFRQWAPEIPLAALSGDPKRRQFLWQQDSSPVKIANYELMTRDIEWAVDEDRPYDLVILDEAQRIKNRDGATHQSVCRLPRNASWALTGTPIENSIEDLVGIFQFVSPGLIHSNLPMKQLRAAVHDHTLRRTKDLVMSDLPPKLIRDEQLDLTSEQELTYRAAEDDGVMKLNAMGDEITIKHVFELVMRLKQICNFDPVTGASSKMDRLLADLEEVVASGQKAIVFSQWVGTLQRIAAQLSSLQPLAFHGRVPSGQRDGVLQEFRDNPRRNVLLISYGAGSVGLNLQFCRYVFLFDRWWNPAVEDQAINRAHRIGAAGSVTVSRMIMAGTIEQRIHEVLAAKRQLFQEILAEGAEHRPLRLTQSDIFGLFDLRTPQGRIMPRVA